MITEVWIKKQNENELFTAIQTRAFILMIVNIVVYQTEYILLMAHRWFDNPFLFYTLKLQMNNGGRQQFFVTPSSHPYKNTISIFLCKIPIHKKTFFKIVTWTTSELFTYTPNNRKKKSSIEDKVNLKKFVQVQMFTSSISQQSSEDCLYARRQTWIFGPKTNSFFMYTIANNNMDGECDRQAKQNTKIQQPRKQRSYISKSFSTQKKSIYFWFWDIFLL